MRNKITVFFVLMIGLLVLSGCEVETEQTYTSEESTEEIERYSMNENIEVDYLVYKIKNIEEVQTIGDSLFNKETNGKFVKIDLEILNNAQETKQIFSPRFNLEDHLERRYDRLDDDLMYVENSLNFGTQLQPGLSESGTIVFELPKDSDDLKLIIRGDFVSVSKVIVDLDSEGVTIDQENNTEDIERDLDSETNPETVKEGVEKYSMNEDIKVDYLTYKITKVEEFTEMGTSMLNKETNGKFIKVYLDIMNNEKETRQIFTPRFKIEDHLERRYDRLNDDMLYVADNLDFGVQLQPGLSESGAIVFELPKDSDDLSLIITGDFVSMTEVIVGLSNINDIRKDTTLKEEQDDMVGDWEEDYDESLNDLEEEYSDLI